MKYKKIDIKILDTTNNVLFNFNELLNNIYTDSLNELAEKLFISKTITKHILEINKEIELQFIKLMNDKHSHKYENDEIKIIMQPQYNYEYFCDKINMLMPLIDKEKFNSIFSPIYKVNRTELKTLKFINDDIDKILETIDKQIVLKPTISIIKK